MKRSSSSEKLPTMNTIKSQEKKKDDGCGNIIILIYNIKM